MGQTIAQALIEEGKLAYAQSSTLDVLNARFTVPNSTLAELNARLQRIQDLSVLRNLLTDAVKVESLDSFIQRLSQLQG